MITRYSIDQFVGLSGHKNENVISLSLVKERIVGLFL
jgi:hypothetical protein